MARSFAGFFSYVRFNDQHDNGRLSEFRDRLAGEIRVQLGESFEIFQDRNDIRWGQQWKQRIDDALDATTILIPIVTPGFFNSPPCRDEVERFLRREAKLGRNDLIFPVYYVNCRNLADESLREKDEIARLFASRQHADWRDLRFEPFTAPIVGKMLAAMAAQIVQALDPPAPPPPVAREKAGAATAQTQAAASPSQAAAPDSVAKTSGSRMEPRTLIVDAFHRGDHATLAGALQAAKPGDRLLVRPGLYKEGIVIDKVVEIIGDGEVGDIVIEATGRHVVQFRATIGRIVNLTLRQAGGGNWFGVDIAQGRLDLEGCDITSASLACVAIHGGADPRLRRNRIHDGKQGGVFVYENGLGALEDNEIFGNALTGVAITTGGNPTLRRNRIHDGKQSGVYVNENGLGTLEDNEIFGNALSGVEITTGGNPTLRRNRIHDGKEGGVMVYENGLGALEDNEIFGNAYSGVEIKTGGNPTLRRNRIHDGKQGGVYVNENGLGALEDNEIFGNAHAGVAIKTGGRPTLRRNTISKNGYRAVWVFEAGGGEFIDNDLRGNARGAFDIAEDCKALVKLEANKV